MKGYVFRNTILKDGEIGGKIDTSEGLQNIRESLAILLATPKGSRAGMPSYGCSIQDKLFDPADPMTELVIKEEIVSAIERWEPRVILKDVYLLLHEDEYTFEVILDYDVKDMVGSNGIMRDVIE